MARAFDDASNQYLSVASAPVTATPLSIACWIYSDDDTIDQTIVKIDDGSTNNWWGLNLDGRNPDFQAEAYTKDVAGGNTLATATANFAANEWHHITGVFTSSTDRAVLLDGANKGTDTASRTPSGTNNLDIGRYNTTLLHLSGAIAEIGVWNTNLTDAEAAVLAKGFSPLLVRPQSLVFYLPCIRDDDEDIVGGLSLTANGGPTVSAHPRVVYPAPPIFYSIPAAGGQPALLRSAQIPGMRQWTPGTIGR